MKKLKLTPFILAALLGVGGIALAAESHDHSASPTSASTSIAATEIGRASCRERVFRAV